jgi:hypothetical protein
MKRPATYFLPLFITTALIMTLAVIVAVYAARTAAVQRGMARAETLFREDQCDKGFAQLVRISYWANQQPALISQLRCAAIIGHVRLEDDDSARARPDRELAGDHATPRPTTRWHALHQQAAILLDPIWLKELGGITPDPQRGYRTLIAELEALDDARRLRWLEVQLARVFGDAPPLTHTIASIPARDYTAPAAAPPTMPIVPIAPVAPIRPAPIPAALSAADFGDGRFAVASGASIRIYDAQGKHSGDLTAGALLVVTGIRKSNGGEIALCQREDVVSASPLLVRTRDLTIRTGDLARVPSHVRDMLVRHGRIQSEIAKEQRAGAASNPHAAAYKQTTAAYNTFIADVKRHTAARDAATGTVRMKHTDLLHGMKNSEPEIRTAYETAKRNYKAWKDSHGNTASPQITALQQRLERVAGELALYFDT